MKISFVSPCYNEVDGLPDFYEAIIMLKKKMARLKLDTEFIIVDDHSNDGTFESLKRNLPKLETARLIRNHQNLGVYRATYQGLRIVSGDIVVPMFPVDLQDPPLVLHELILKKLECKSAAVMGKKKEREESKITEFLRLLFYRLLTFTSGGKISKNVGEFGVVDRWIVDEIIKKDDYYPFIRSMIPRLTNDIIFIDYTWVARTHGTSHYSLLDYYSHAINGFLSNGSSLFRPVIIFGFFVALSSLIFGLVNIVLYIFNAELFPIKGIPSILVIFSMILGFIVTVIGFIGEFILAIHDHVRRVHHIEKINEIDLNNNQI